MNLTDAKSRPFPPSRQRVELFVEYINGRMPASAVKSSTHLKQGSQINHHCTAALRRGIKMGWVKVEMIKTK